MSAATLQGTARVAAVRAPGAREGGPGSTGRRLNVYWLLLLPLALPLSAFYLWPLAKVLWLSVSDPTLGFANYERLWRFPAQRRVLWTTLRLGALTTCLALVMGYVVAYAMTQVGRRHRLWMTAFVLVPFWVSVLVRGFAWLTLLRSEGVVNNALIGLGAIGTPLELVRNELGVVIGMTHYLVPYAVLPLVANMQGIDARLVPAARSLGARPWTAFRTVFLPLSKPGIAAAALLVFIFSLGFYVTPALLGGGKVMMLAEYVSIQTLQTVRWGLGAMMASVLLISVLVLLALMARLVDLRAVFGAR